MLPYLIAGNWKMHGSIEFCKTFCTALVTVECPQVEILVCPPTLYVPQVATLCQQSNIQIGAQNCYFEREGAYTGEVSPWMLRDFGCNYVIIGHSERRQYFAEDDRLVAKKALAVIEAGLTPIVCVGETKQQREENRTFDVVGGQIKALLDVLPKVALASVVVAYEPIWAIGTGLTATPSQAQEVHAFVRGLFAKQDPKIASVLRILYGGSVKAENAAELFQQPDINGGLVGGASLKVEDFIAICRHATEMT